MGKKQFCFFQTAETGNRTPDSGVKGSGANHYPRAPALVHGKFVHFSADNIDINDVNLDGKNIFHGTQMAAWERGPARDVILDDQKPSTRYYVLHVPEAMDSGPSP